MPIFAIRGHELDTLVDILPREDISTYDDALDYINVSYRQPNENRCPRIYVIPDTCSGWWWRIVSHIGMYPEQGGMYVLPAHRFLLSQACAMFCRELDLRIKDAENYHMAMFDNMDGMSYGPITSRTISRAVSQPVNDLIDLQRFVFNRVITLDVYDYENITTLARAVEFVRGGTMFHEDATRQFVLRQGWMSVSDVGIAPDAMMGLRNDIWNG